MIREKRVSLWLGRFDNKADFEAYTEGKYDEEGNYCASDFQKDFGIERYDFDAIEKDWMGEMTSDAEGILIGFSSDYEIIPQYAALLDEIDLTNINCVMLLYHFEYTEKMPKIESPMRFIGVADVSI